MMICPQSVKSTAMFLTTSPVILTAEALVKKASKKEMGAACVKSRDKSKAPARAMII